MKIVIRPSTFVIRMVLLLLAFMLYRFHPSETRTMLIGLAGFLTLGAIVFQAAVNLGQLHLRGRGDEGAVRRWQTLFEDVKDCLHEGAPLAIVFLLMSLPSTGTMGVGRGVAAFFCLGLLSLCCWWTQEDFEKVDNAFFRHHKVTGEVEMPTHPGHPLVWFPPTTRDILGLAGSSLLVLAGLFAFGFAAGFFVKGDGATYATIDHVFDVLMGLSFVVEGLRLRYISSFVKTLPTVDMGGSHATDRLNAFWSLVLLFCGGVSALLPVVDLFHPSLGFRIGVVVLWALCMAPRLHGYILEKLRERESRCTNTDRACDDSTELTHD